MYKNEYNLRELLELTLRVPEVGAVNFNILYYILKTVIEKQGIAEIKPNFSLQSPFATSSNVRRLNASLRKSHSDESLTSIDSRKIEKEEDHLQKIPKSSEKESTKWQKIFFSKRMDAIEDEISELHIILAQLGDKISNSERVIGLQETKFVKQITELHHLLAEYDSLAQKFEKISSQVSMISQLAEKSKIIKEREEEESEGSDTKVATKSKEIKEGENHDESEDSYMKIAEKTEEINKSEDSDVEVAGLDKRKSIDAVSDKSKLKDTVVDETKVKDFGLDETTSKKNDEKLDEKNLEEIDVLPDSKLEKASLETEKKEREKTEFGESKSGQTKLPKEDGGFTEKIEKIDREIYIIKKKLETVEKSVFHPTEKVQKPIYDKKESLEPKDRKIVEEKVKFSKADVTKIDLELLNVSSKVNKVMEKCEAVDKTLTSELNKIKEKYLIFDKTFGTQCEDLEALKLNWDEMVHSFEGIKENLQYIEKEMIVLTEFPGIRNRVELLEEYMYSGSEADGKAAAKETFITNVEKETKPASEEKDIVIFKPSVKRAEKTKAQKIEEYLDTETTEKDFRIAGKFLAVSRNISLIQDMERKRQAEKFQIDDLYDAFKDEDDYYEEPIYKTVEKPTVEDFGVLEKIPSRSEVKIVEQTQEKIESSTFTSPDVLEEFSTQLRGQVIVFVKKRLHDFEIELQQIEGNLVSMGKKVNLHEKMSKDLSEKVAFMDSNFSQRAGDLATLTEMAGNHQGSIMNIVRHLERKAEAYVVNQKVSKTELTVIEDRVLKLCSRTSSEISKMEERIDDSLEKFTRELDRKLFTEEFEVRLEFLMHKLKMMERKLKDISVENPILDFEGIRPVEIKKYAVSKDGTRLRQSRRRIATWNTSDNIIPILTQHDMSLETSPKTAAQIQKELEQASYRESKRYVEGAYTKIKISMEERNIPYRHDYIPILHQDGPLDITPYECFHSGKHYGSLTTHSMILPRPDEIRTLRNPHCEEMRMIDRMPWMQRQAHLQGRVDHRLQQVLRDRGSACNHGHLVMPDYIVPGYTGCLHKNPLQSAHIFKRCCPTANYDYDIIQHKMPYEYQRISEPCKQITPIVPSFRLCQARREWL